MCDNCGPETIHHIPGERAIDRYTCFCRCHDRTTDEGHLLCGAARGDEAAAVTACMGCRWAHVVAFSTAEWGGDDRYHRPPATPEPLTPAQAAGFDTIRATMGTRGRRGDV